MRHLNEDVPIPVRFRFYVIELLLEARRFGDDDIPLFLPLNSNRRKIWPSTCDPAIQLRFGCLHCFADVTLKNPRCLLKEDESIYERLGRKQGFASRRDCTTAPGNKGDAAPKRRCKPFAPVYATTDIGLVQ